LFLKVGGATAGAIQKAIFVLFNMPKPIFNLIFRILPSKMKSYIVENMPKCDNIKRGADKSNNEALRKVHEEIKEKTGWSDKIVKHISNMQEAQVYMDAGLKEGTVNGRPALLNPKIHGSDMNANIWMAKENPKWKDWTNADLMGEGYPPRDDKGDAFELHHIGQDPDGPLAELTYDQHHSNGNFEKLHSNFDESKIDRQKFDKEKSEYWQARSKDFGDNPQG